LAGESACPTEIKNCIGGAGGFTCVRSIRVEEPVSVERLVPLASDPA
jgi:hypothetical protein